MSIDIRTTFRKKQIIYIGLIFGSSLILFGLRENIFNKEVNSVNLAFILTGAAYMIMSIALLIFRFIEQSSEKPHTSDKALEKALYELRAKIADLNLKTKGSNIDTKQIDDLIEEKISVNLENYIKEYIDAQYGSKIEEALLYESLQDDIDELQSGVNYQIIKLSRSSTINLIIGLITTVSAIGVLISLTLDIYSVSFKDSKDVLIYIIPRAMLAFFIEVFSFFFLRLYKRNLDDVKYFHNERTNIDSKIIALKTALSTTDNDLIKDIIRNFSNVERNFILKKDESTIALEQNKLDFEQEKNYLSKVSEIINLLKK